MVYFQVCNSVELIILSALGLHNYLQRSSSSSTYTPVGLADREEDGHLIPGRWRQESSADGFAPLAVPSTGHNASLDAKLVRETFKDYFFSEGSVDWQWNLC